MLTSVLSQAASGARPLSIGSSGAKTLAPVGASLLNNRHAQQTRDYRFGVWSSFLEPEYRRSVRQRHRIIKYKYAESLNRRLSWDPSPSPEDPKASLRRHVGRYCHWPVWQLGNRMASSSGGRDPNGDAPDPGHHAARFRSLWTEGSPFESASEPSTSEEYFIDPITNRRVWKKTYGNPKRGNQDTATPPNPYESQPGGSRPPQTNTAPPLHSDGPPPSAELNKYQALNIDQVTTNRVAAIDDMSAADGFKYPNQPTESEEYSLNHLPPEETAERYEDLHKYQPTEHDVIQSTVETPYEKYEDLDLYKPTEHDEIKDTWASSVEKYEDLHKYKPTEHDEIRDISLESPPKYEDLHNYRPAEHDEIIGTVVDPKPMYDDLNDYRLREHDEIITPEESMPKYEDLGKYKTYEGRDDFAVDENENTPKYKDLDQYQPLYHQEDKVAADSGPEYEDLDKYRSGIFKDLQPAPEEQPFEQYGDLDQYKAFRYQEPDGKAAVEQDIVEESLEEFDGKKENRENLEDAMTGYIAVSDAVDREASASIQHLRQRFQDGEPSVNIFRDSPEAFMQLLHEEGLAEKSKAQALADGTSSASAGEKARLAEMQEAERAHHDILSETNNQARLETALNRQSASHQGPASSTQSKRFRRRRRREERETDPYMKALQENDGTSLLTQSGTTESLFGPEKASCPEPEPTVYKILAYDPTMQSISIAETTSVVPDQAAPLTPSEVLLRLSNPSKFFPHFDPLRAEGFEIVSGSGDVLVFRKVREAAPPAPISTQTQTQTPEETNAPPVNPIDMMGRQFLPNAAASRASPTGFINYNDPPPVDPPSFSPYTRSPTDARPGEPVFGSDVTTGAAGRRTKHKKRRSVTRRVLIGGLWVAGTSYALGVICEYFATGGLDGRGPTGL